MRGQSKHSRELRASYLYSNGALVEWFEEKRGGVRLGHTVDITYGYADVKIWPQYKNAFNAKPVEGRIILGSGDDAMIKLVKGAQVEAIYPSHDGGSENTRNRSIAVGYLHVTTKKLGTLTWIVFENLINTGITIQKAEGDAYKFPLRDDGNPWLAGMLFFSDSVINRVVNLKPEVPAPDAAPHTNADPVEV